MIVRTGETWIILGVNKCVWKIGGMCWKGKVYNTAKVMRFKLAAQRAHSKGLSNVQDGLFCKLLWRSVYCLISHVVFSIDFSYCVFNSWQSCFALEHTFYYSTFQFRVLISPVLAIPAPPVVSNILIEGLIHSQKITHQLLTDYSYISWQVLLDNFMAGYSLFPSPLLDS